MRVTDQMMYQNLAQNIDQAQAAYVRTSQEASSGVSISQPSDNPAGTALVLQLTAAQQQVSAWQANASAAQSRMETGDQALSQIQTDLGSAQSLATQASSSSVSASQLADMGKQAASILSDVASLVNTQYAGQYVFSGAAQQAPVTWNSGGTVYTVGSEQSGGSFVPQSIEVGNGVVIPTSVDATSVLGGQTFTFTSSGQDASAMPQWLQQRAEALGQIAPAGTPVGTPNSPFPAGQPPSTYVDSSTTPNTTTVPLTTSSVTSSSPVTYGTSLIDVLSYLQEDLASGNTAAVEADLGALQSHGQTLSSVQAALGANLDRIKAAVAQLQTTVTQLQTQIGSVQNVDMAQVTAQLVAQQTAYQAAISAGAQMKLPTLANYVT